MSRSLAQLAQEALAVQDACNLCGVAQGFARALIDLGDHTSGTNERNTHPIAMVWADKIAHLTGTQESPTLEMTRAYSKVHDLAKGSV